MAAHDQEHALLVDAADVGHALNRFARLSGHVAAQASGRGIDRATSILLALLVTEGPRRSSELAEAMHSDPSTISRHVSHLVEDGLVVRTVDPEDGRACKLVATGDGVRRWEAMQRQRSRAIAGVVAAWDPADRRALTRLLRRFVDDYETHLPELLTALTEHGPTGPLSASRPAHQGRSGEK